MELPRVIGHRGAAKRAPENTLAGFRTAAALGLRWVEFDVRLTADDRLVLLHDDRLDRTTNGSGKVRARSLHEIRALDAGAWFSAEFAGERVPTLEEAIERLAALGLGANIEIKCAPGEEAAAGRATARVVTRCWPADRPLPLITSFRDGCVAAAAAEAPELPRGYLMGEVRPGWERRCAALGCRTVHCNQRLLDRAAVARLKRAGLPLLVYTVNERERARQLFDFGVDGVFSDVPDVVLEVA